MRFLVSAMVLLAAFAPLAAPPAGAPSASQPLAVLQLSDTGINPYHVNFRDPGALAQQHPCTYIPLYPCSAQALNLTFNAADYASAYLADKAAVWDNVQPQTLYWVPGTRIVGAISFGAGGTNCPVVPYPPANALGFVCPERRILDDHGHGTMTASRAAGQFTSQCGECRIVAVEGLGPAGLKWAANQGWIDVSSHSWLNLVPPPANQLQVSPGDCLTTPPPACFFNPQSTAAAFAYAQSRMLTLAASGNGAAYLGGAAPTPTYALSTAAPGVVLVGGHDNGRVSQWSGAPAHVVADAFGGWAADRDSYTAMGPRPMSCCTSAAAPYAAGAAAALVLEARTILGDTLTGVRAGGVVAQGPAGLVPASSPIADGTLTLDELRSLVYHSAQRRPAQGVHDGLVNFVSDPHAPSAGELTDFGPGGNPFCQLCIAAPVKWSDVPDGPFAVAHLGYGALNEFSVAKGKAVLQGTDVAFDRPVEDLFFTLDAAARGVFFAGT